MTSRGSLLIFGGRGAIGSAIVDGALAQNWTVVATTRASGSDSPGRPSLRWLDLDPFMPNQSYEGLKQSAPFSAVCWAQGANLNDSIFDVDLSGHEALYRANVVYVLATLQRLLADGLLQAPAKLCVISSIWQNLARQNKLSYAVTKAALQGLVMSASADLARDGHLINAVLPGVLDTPMTRRNLAPEQLERIEGSTLFGTLPTVDSVVELVLFLCSERNVGVTGQFIAADLGFSHVRIV